MNIVRNSSCVMFARAAGQKRNYDKTSDFSMEKFAFGIPPEHIIRTLVNCYVIKDTKRYLGNDRDNMSMRELGNASVEDLLLQRRLRSANLVEGRILYPIISGQLITSPVIFSEVHEKIMIHVPLNTIHMLAEECDATKRRYLLETKLSASIFPTLLKDITFIPNIDWFERAFIFDQALLGGGPQYNSRLRILSESVLHNHEGWITIFEELCKIYSTHWNTPQPIFHPNNQTTYPKTCDIETFRSLTSQSSNFADNRHYSLGTLRAIAIPVYLH